MIRIARLARLAAPAAVALALALALAPALAPATARAATFDLAAPVAADTVPRGKRTPSGLYLTAADAARVLAAHPNVALVDVRSPAEIALIGYATPTAAHIPVGFMDPSHRYSAKHGTYAMMRNPGFVDEFKAWLASDAAQGIDTVLVICRSGSRSAAAVRMLTEAGVEVPLWSVVDGFEGDRNAAGARDVNGWRNDGLPWTYRIRPGLWPGHN